MSERKFLTNKQRFWFYLDCASLFRKNKVAAIEVRRTLKLAKMYRKFLEMEAANVGEINQNSLERENFK